MFAPTPHPTSTRRATVLASLICALLLPISLSGQSTATYVPPVTRGLGFELSIKNIMQGPEHIGSAPSGVRWSDDSEWIYFNWKPGGMAWDAPTSLYRVSADGGEPEMVSAEEEKQLNVVLSGGDISPDRAHKVASVGGDLYLIDRDSGETTRLTDTSDSEAAPRFSGDGREIFYQSGGHLFALGLDGGTLRQLTDIRSGPAPGEDPPADGQRGFLEQQQRELFENIRRQQDAAATRRVQAAMDDAEERLQPVYLDRNERANGLTVSPNGQFILFSAFTPSQGTQGTIVPDWITESGYTEDLNVRTKVGDNQASTRVGLITEGNGDIVWLDYPGVAADRDISANVIGWSEVSAHGLVRVRSRDNKEWWLFSVDPSSGETTLLDTLRDEAWVGGPCGFCMGWIPGQDRVYYVSEENGYSHVYAVNADGTDKQALTRGEWEVRGLSIPEDRSHFLLNTGEDTLFNTHLWSMNFDGSNRTQITRGDGNFNATPSPDGSRFAVVHSKANRPGELFVMDSDAGSEMDQITVSPTPEWLTFGWIEPEIVRFEAEDGAMVPARIYRPEDMGAEANGAAVLFVHGAGYLHNVHNWWSNYFREYMFNHLLAANGYTVLDIDYRGSAGYGAEWRTGIYRWMGGKDMSDHVDGARYLMEEEGIEAGRIGIYGGSYGGFITLMALFTAPETFEAGAALRSVTDWAHYNHGYTSNILNTPQLDEEAYRQSSPIYFAENFQGHLLMAHGMVDTNVHFSDVVRLSQRLIELGKENWELAVYPVENHGFVEPTSWTDEYRRIFELFERTIGSR